LDGQSTKKKGYRKRAIVEVAITGYKQLPVSNKKLKNSRLVRIVQKLSIFLIDSQSIPSFDNIGIISILVEP
jgi:hypothetical protein